jgi:hypothetical protein
MTVHHHPYDKRLDEPGIDTRSPMRWAEYSWIVGSLLVIGLFAAIYGYGQYKATTDLETASSQVETLGAASTPSPPPSTTGQGGMR